MESLSSEHVSSDVNFTSFCLSFFWFSIGHYNIYQLAVALLESVA